MSILTQNIFKLPLQSEKSWYLFSSDKKPIHPSSNSGLGWDKEGFLSNLISCINHKLNGDYYLGLGIHGTSNLFCMDLDSCLFLNGLVEGSVLQKWAAPIIDFAIKSKLYIEKSISGRGLHIIGKCVDFDKSIHTKHIYTKADTKNNIKSEQIELYLSTDTEKCKRGILITGDLYEECTYDQSSPLPTVSKKEFIKLFEAVKATKLVQAITRIDFKIVSHKFKEEDVSNIIQSQKAPTNIDVVDIALFEDAVKFLHNYEDKFNRSYDQVVTEYQNLKDAFYKKVMANSDSENDFIYILLLTKYSVDRNVLVDCLVNSPRGSFPDRNKKMNEKHSSDGRTYAELTVDKALDKALEKIPLTQESGDICMTYEAGMKYMNSRYVKFQEEKEMKVIEFYFNNREGHTYSVYSKNSAAEGLHNFYVISRNSKNEFIRHKLFYLWFYSNYAKIIKGFYFQPNQPPIIHDEKNGHSYFNKFRGWAVDSKESFIVETWLNYVKEVICSNDQEDFDYFINYFAHLFQKPHNLPGVALVLKSDKGIGKNLILEPIQGILGKSLYFISTKTVDLAGDFNKNVGGKLLIIANEALFAGDHAAQDNMKGLIADKEISITAKHVDSKMDQNFARIVILTNRSTAINFDPSERRYRFFNCNDDFASVRITPENDTKKQNLIKIINSEEYLPEQKDLSVELQEGLLHFFLNRDISNFDPRIFKFGKNAGTIRTKSNNPVSQFFFNFIVTGRLGGNGNNNLFKNYIFCDTCEELCFNPKELHKYYEFYHKDYCSITPMDFPKFREEFVNLFLDGNNKTYVRKVLGNSVSIRVWRMGTRQSLAQKYNLEMDTDIEIDA